MIEAHEADADRAAEDEVGSGLESLAALTLRPFALAGAVILGAAGALTPILSDGRAGPIVSGTCLVASALFLTVFLRDRARPVPAARANAVLGGLLALGAAAFAVSSVDSVSSMTGVYLLVVLLLPAWLLTAPRAFLVTQAAGLAAWGLIVAVNPGAFEWDALVVLPLVGVTFAAVTFTSRVRMHADHLRARSREARSLAALQSATRAAKESEARLRALVTAAPVVLFALDKDGAFTSSAGQALGALGLREGEAVGQSLFTMFPDAPDAHAMFARALAGETVIQKMPVRAQVYDMVMSPTRDEQGTVTGVTGVATDVTERARAEDALRRSERLSALGTLVAGLAHEINNPLQYMAGNVELAQLELADATRVSGVPAEALALTECALKRQDTVLKGARRIAEIASGLRRVARSDSGTRQPVSLNTLAGEVMDLAGSRLGADVEVTTEYLSALVPAVNAQGISQVLLGLVLNAADAMDGRPGAHLTVRTFDEDERVIVEVADTGAGIPWEQQALIFTPFHTTKHHGTGLGLSIALRIVEDHDGLLTFKSTPGVGTTFRVEIPLVAAPVVQGRAPVAVEAARERRGGPGATWTHDATADPAA